MRSRARRRANGSEDDVGVEDVAAALQTLDAFLVDNAELEALNARLSTFNLFRVLRAERVENHFDPVWDALFPREQARIVRLLIERVGFDGERGTLSVTFRPNGIKALAQEMQA